MQLLIKNMVCNRCVRVVREDLESIGLKIIKTEIGYIEIEAEPSEIQYQQIQNILQKSGFELIFDQHLALIEHIKKIIIKHVYYKKNEEKEHQSFSKFLVKKLGYDYSYLSTMFSTVEKTTIEKYIILQKIERTKEFLFNGEFNLSEIAWQLDYSSVAHLSNQFKQIVGITPSAYKKEKILHRYSIDSIGV